MPTSRKGIRSRKRAIEKNRDQQLAEFYAALAAGQKPEAPKWVEREQQDDPKKFDRRRERAEEKARQMAAAREKRAKARQADAGVARARISTGGPGRRARADAGDDLLEEAGISGEGTAGGSKKSKPRRAANLTAPVGSGGTGLDSGKAIGGIDESTAPLGYFNVPGFTEDAANTGFGPITTEGIAAVKAANAGDPRFDAWSQPAVPSRYQEDDDQRLLAQLYGTDAFLDFQAALKARNPGRSKYTPGVIDNNTREWTRQAMADANALGVSLTDVLFGGLSPTEDDSSGGGGGGGGRGGGGRGGGGGGGGGAVGPLTDPESIRQAADDIAQEVMGRRLDAGFKEELVGEIHALETSEDASGITTDIDAQLRRKIRERMGGETRGYDLASATQVVVDMFNAGPGGGIGSGFGQKIGSGPVGGAPA